MQRSTTAVFVFFAGFFFVRTFLMPLTYDDFPYSFVWDGERGGNLNLMTGSPELEHRDRVSSLGDIAQSMWSHYFTWGGRIFAHGLAQFFLWMGKPAFDIANTIIFVLIAVTILKLADAPKKFSPTALAWIFFCLLFVTRGLMMTTFWLTGACNYLWMPLFQMLFLAPYVKALRTNSATNSRLLFALMILLGLAAGWSNEAGALATICLTTFFVGMSKVRGLLRPWMIVGLIVLIVSCTLMIFAPGNIVRLNVVYPGYHYTSAIFLDHLTNEFYKVIRATLISLLPMFVYFWRRGGGRFNTSEILMAAFAATSFVIPLAMLFSPEFTLRVSTNSMIFALVASSIAVVELDRQRFKFTLNLSEKIRRGLVVGVSATFLIYCATLIYVDVTVFNATNRQLQYIRQNASLDVIELPPLEVSHLFDKIHGEKSLNIYTRHFGGVVANPKDCRNIFVSQYYGVKSVVAVDSNSPLPKVER